MTKINPLSIKIEGLDLKLGNIESFVQTEKRLTDSQRSQITRYISDYISEEIGLGRKMSNATKAKYTTPETAPDGQIDTEEFFNLTGIRVSQSSVLKDEAQQATFEAKVGRGEDADVSFTAIDVGGKTNVSGFKEVRSQLEEVGKKNLTGIEAYNFLENASNLSDEFRRLKGALTEKMENLLLVKILDADKGKRTELVFVKNPLRGLDLRRPETFTKYISLRLRPRTKKVEGQQDRVITAYRIEARATKALIKTFESKKITDKVIKAHSNAYSTGLQKYVFKRLDQYVRESKNRPNNERIRALAAYTVALAREFEAGGQTPLTTRTGITVPSLFIRAGEARIITPRKKRERQRFISGIQLTQLVQQRLGKTMRKFGDPLKPDLTERSGRFRTSVEIIANYRKNIVAYRYNPIYDNLDKYGYKPSEQVGKATREVVQTLFARAFNIVKG